MRKTTKEPQDSLSPGRDLNPGTIVYEAGELILNDDVRYWIIIEIYGLKTAKVRNLRS
jgi:hypothetical protein